ncbi:MAG: NUDIX hydrolase [Balneolaceae bacterium]
MNSGRTDRNRIRIRSSALILREEKILLVQLDGPTRPYPIWIPPGGEVIPGEPLHEAVIREVEEEAGIRVEPIRISLHHQFVSPPFHAIEYYWLCDWVGGVPKLGSDPDRPGDAILTDIAWVPLIELSDRPVFPECLRTGMERYGRRDGCIELQLSDERGV